MRLFLISFGLVCAGICGFSEKSFARANPLQTTAASTAVSDALLDQLSFMRSVYRAGYAPAAWKAKFAGWTLDQEYAKAVKAARENPQMGIQEAREILKNFIYSMKDYHVSIGFESTEKASLPFTVRGTQGKLYLVEIDRTKLPESAFPFQLGDELVSFGDQTAHEAVAAVQAQVISNVEATDRALAELKLTRRQASRGYLVPRGPVVVGIKPKGSDQVRKIQLIWEYTPEKIKGLSPLNIPRVLTQKGVQARNSLRSPMMSADLELTENPHGMGARKSFIPDLGPKIWESAPGNPFYAYIYKTPDRRLIGYVRIASYMQDNAAQAAAEFGKIISTFEAVTDGLVIDQVNNPGGSVFYLYALASMLSPDPLRTPQHEMAITPTEVAASLKQLEMMKGIKDDETAKKVLGETNDGYPVNYEVAQFTMNFLNFIVDEWNAGRTLSRPYWIEGADNINPSPIHYTKPILILINELDFSGGDFFPAIMQDNRRVTLFGTRTAGAGGYVNEVIAPNALGVAQFRITGSIAKRANQNPIENLGVQPDIEYVLSEKDFTDGFSEYVQAIQNAMGQILK